MQFFILLLGILIFAFYLNRQAPVFFDESKVERGLQTSYRDSLLSIEQSYQAAHVSGNQLRAAEKRREYKQILAKALPGEDVNDTNYIFLRFVKEHFPVGLIGIILAIIFLSAWGSIAAALNSLAACTMVDFHKRYWVRADQPIHEYRVSQWYTLAWGIFCIIISMFAHNLGNSLIEAVNILGSLFYGVILGIFLVAFWIDRIRAGAVFFAAIVSEALVIGIYRADIISFLWLNVIGALLVIVLGALFQAISGVLPMKNSSR